MLSNPEYPFDKDGKRLLVSGEAGVAKLVDAPDLGSGAVRRGGSSPSTRTKLEKQILVTLFQNRVENWDLCYKAYFVKRFGRKSSRRGLCEVFNISDANN